MPIIDAHAHLEPHMLELPLLVDKMQAEGVDKIVLIPAMNDPLPETSGLLLGLFRNLMASPLHPLARALNARFYTPEGHLKLKGTVYKIYAEPDNHSVADALRDYPDHFLGWIFLNPRAPGDALEELERWRQVPGFVGVKLHPHWHRYPVVEALPIAKRCEELGLPILIHLGFAEHGAWQVLASRCPKLMLIFAHAGMPHFARVWDYVRDNPMLHVDVSSPYLSERLVRRAVKVAGPERVLYGTDAPYGFPSGDHGCSHCHDLGHDHSYDYRAIKHWVERLPCGARGIDRILGDNVLRLLGEQR